MLDVIKRDDGVYEIRDPDHPGEVFDWDPASGEQLPEEIVHKMTQWLAENQGKSDYAKPGSPGTPTGSASDGGGIGGMPSGKQMWDFNFRNHSPSGWSSGGWHPMGSSAIHGMTSRQYGQSYVDNWRNNVGLPTLYHEGGPGGRWDQPSRRQLPFEQQAQAPEEISNMHDWDDTQQDAYDGLSPMRQRMVDFRKSRGI